MTQIFDLQSDNPTIKRRSNSFPALAELFQFGMYDVTHYFARQSSCRKKVVGVFIFHFSFFIFRFSFFI